MIEGKRIKGKKENNGGKKEQSGKKREKAREKINKGKHQDKNLLFKEEKIYLPPIFMVSFLGEIYITATLMSCFIYYLFIYYLSRTILMVY